MSDGDTVMIREVRHLPPPGQEFLTVHATIQERRMEMRDAGRLKRELCVPVLPQCAEAPKQQSQDKADEYGLNGQH